MEGNKKGLVVFLVVLVLLLLGCLGFGAYKYLSLNKKYDNLNSNYNQIKTDYEKIKNESEQVEKKQNEQNNGNYDIEDTYVYDTSDSHKGYGTVVVEGYATVEKMSAFGGTWNYVFFNITNCDNEDFMKYLKQSSSTAFAKNNAIGIGSVTNKIIERTSFSDQFGMKTEKLSKTDSDSILNSSASNVIKLQLEILKDSNSHGEPPESTSPINNLTIIG